jgi:DNA-binding LacI/PurR family transcriptional regulator
MSTRYERIREHVVRGITSGQYVVGEVLPAADVLASKLRCSTGTVRNVLTDLAQEGLLKRVQRRGTVVARRPSAGRVLLFMSVDTHTNQIMQDPIFTSLLEAGYWVDLIPTSMGVEGATAHCHQLLNDSVEADALVAIEPRPELYPLLDQLRSRVLQRIMVELDVTTPNPDRHHIVVNHFKAARDVAEHLLKLGHKRVALFAGLGPGERSWLAEAARNCRDFIEVAGGKATLHYMADGHKQLVSLVKEQGITAYWAIHDFECMQAMNALHRDGLRVPDDVTLIGRHDTPWAVQCRPQLTSVSINPTAIATAIVNEVKRVTAERGKPVETRDCVTRIDPILIIRDSSGKAPVLRDKRSPEPTPAG